MKENIIELVETILKSDQSINTSKRKRLIRLMGAISNDEITQDMILTRAEAARLLGRSSKTVDRLVARRGIKKVISPNRQRAVGLRLSDVARLLARKGGK